MSPLTLDTSRRATYCGTMNATEAPTIHVGDTVIGKPIGQSRRQRVHVTQVEPIDGCPDVILGYLWSAKYPGDYRGQASLFADAVEEVIPATTA